MNMSVNVKSNYLFDRVAVNTEWKWKLPLCPLPVIPCTRETENWVSPMSNVDDLWSVNWCLLTVMNALRVWDWGRFALMFTPPRGVNMCIQVVREKSSVNLLISHWD